MLVDYAWPGNVRQLENAVFRAVVLCDGTSLSTGDFPHIRARPGRARSPNDVGRGTRAAPGGQSGASHLALINGSGGLRELADVEADVIRFALDHHEGQMSKVARQLGIGRSTLYRKVRELGLDAVAGEAD